MKKFNVFMCLSLFSFIFSGCGGNAASGKSLLFKVSGNGLAKPSYIFGTHHMAPVSVLDGYKNFEKAFNSADVIAGELLMTDMGALQAALQPHMVAPEGFSYAEALSAEDYHILDSVLTVTLGVGLDMYGMIHPSGLSSIYTNIIYAKVMEDIDIMNHVSMDQYIQDLALEKGKKVAALETVDDQVYALFYSDTPENQVKALVAMAKRPDFYEESARELNHYYLERDLDKLYELAFNNPDDPEPISEEMAYALNKERNDKWLEIIPGMMSENSCFFAVGAIHLAGEEGLVSRLREMGYTVEPLK